MTSGPQRRSANPDPIKTAVWPRLVKFVVQRDRRCWICGHFGPADTMTADHVIPRTEDPSRALDVANMRAAHHKPCPVCSQAAGSPIRCNLIRGAMSRERAVRIIEKRTGLDLSGTAVTAETEGREW